MRQKFKLLRRIGIFFWIFAGGSRENQQNFLVVAKNKINWLFVDHTMRIKLLQ